MSTVKLSQRSKLARQHLRGAIRAASDLPQTREENERCKKQIHIGVRWTLTLLGVGAESLLSRFVMERLQDWLKQAERRIEPEPAPARKGPHRIASEKRKRSA